jgi:hypothetical protein
MVRLLGADDVLADLRWNKIVTPAIYHPVVDREVMIQIVILDEILLEPCLFEPARTGARLPARNP